MPPTPRSPKARGCAVRSSARPAATSLPPPAARSLPVPRARRSSLPPSASTTATYIIHAVGPVYSQYTPDDARELLRSAYRAAMERAAQNGCRSVAFPAISTGVYGYPLEDACREAVAVCKAASAETGILVKLVAFDERTAAALRRYGEG